MGLVLVIPPVWQAAQVALNKRFPRFTCSKLKTVVLPEPSTARVLVASSNSIAEALLLKVFKKQKIDKVIPNEIFLNIIFIRYFIYLKLSIL